ncbi:MAG TPA: FtsX-like permease family protein, partial [Myxococcaceae bacterium]|nr:FtsX-like permease family protein [Myxococcaceae bacterium]
AIGGFLGGVRLDSATVERLRALPGVAELYRKMNVRVPAVSRYSGDFFGAPLRVGLEVAAVGVDAGLVEKDVQLGPFEDPGPGRPIPAVAASRVLEIYNKTFAPVRKLPQLSPQMVAGFAFPVDFNRSMVTPTPSGPVTSTQVQLVGFSERGLLAGVTVPLETARRLNRASGADAETLTSVVLRATNPSRVPDLTEAVRRMGLKVDDAERRLAENVGAAVAVTTSALALLAALVCALAAVNIAHALSAQVRARAKEIGVMVAVGASRADVRRLVFGEAAALGGLGGLVGLSGARVAAWAVDALSRRYLPEFPFKPESYFEFSAGLVLGGLALGIAAALAGAYLPGRRAAALDPARTLAG